MINSTSMDNLLPYITESIKNGGQFVFYPKGTSMLPTIIPEKDCVVLIEPFNLKKYAKELENIIMNEDLLKRLSQNNDITLKKFDIDYIYTKWINLFKKLTEQ